MARWLGFLEDFFTVAVAVALGAFAVIRIRNAPRAQGARVPVLRLAHRRRLAGAGHDLHVVMDDAASYRGAQFNTGHFPYGHSGAVRIWRRARAARRWARPPTRARDRRPAAAHRRHHGLPGARGALQAPAHLRRAAQRRRKRLPDALGPLLPMESGGKPIDFEDPGEDDIFGRGKIEDFTWKGMLDFATCTECGRCQSQCPAWNTGQAVVAQAGHHGPARPPVRGARRTSLAGTEHEEATPAGRPGWPRAASSTRTCCGRAPPAAPASSSARWTSSTSTTSWTCAATR